MAKILRITVETGPHKNTKYCLRGPGECLIGRAPECLVQLHGTERDRLVSRQHCRLMFDADDLSLGLQDLGSRNGTYLNGQRIGSQRTPLCDECCRVEETHLPSQLLTVGGTTLRIDCVECPSRVSPDGPMLWCDGETSKKDCPVTCSI
jgi:FHA domain